MFSVTPGNIKATEHIIQLVSVARPIHQKPYRAGMNAREVEGQEVNGLLKKGIIEPSFAEWVSSVVLGRKSDDSLLFLVDYRRLNSVTVRDAYHIPRKDEFIDSSGDAELFSTPNCTSGYWQVHI